MRPAIVGWPFVFKGRQMNSRIPFRRENEAMGRIGAARRRIENLKGRTDIGTEDPLMAEIQMAQLDALLGIGYMMAGIESKMQVMHDLHQRVERLDAELEEVMKLVVAMHGAQILSRNKPSWWDRITRKE